MRLLVSVTCAGEAVEAASGGADIVDAKDPSAGALGAVRLEAFRAIRGAVPDDAVLSAALGDAAGLAEAERLAEEFASSGARFVKIGFAGVVEAGRAAELTECAVRGCQRGASTAGVIAVAYADASRVRAVDARALVQVAGDAGAHGVLVDTADKSGPGLTALWGMTQLADWVAMVHELEMVASVAGKLSLDDIDLMRDVGADIVGVRGAACVGGRLGRVSSARVCELGAKVGSDSIFIVSSPRGR
jgi:(5-formylfuran-3-yl)methyl phosphate synthase